MKTTKLTKHLNKIVCSALIVATVVGARLETVITPYLLIGVVIAVCLAVVTGHIKRDYPLYIFTISLCMLWQSSLLGQQVVGSDVHSELYISSLSLQNGWDWSLPHQYNTSIVVGAIAPFISKVTSIDLVWIYKIVFPLCLAFVPMIMYYAFRNIFGEKRAFWSAIFFTIVPVMSMELVGIAKSMVAELTFSLLILVMVSHMRQLYKALLMIVLAVLTFLCHYTVGFILLYLLGAILCIKVVMWITRRKLGESRLKLVVLISVVTAVLGTGFAYFSVINNGAMVKFVTQRSSNLTAFEWTILDDVREPVATTTSETSEVVQPNGFIEYLKSKIHSWSGQSALVKAGVGVGYSGLTVLGKAFWLIQYITQGLIVLGLIQLWRKRREYNSEFTFGVVAGFSLLILCILIPFFGTVTNITRVYQLVLFFLAPMFVLGCELISGRRWLWIVAPILLAYFLFTSGLIFEVTQSSAQSGSDMPYSLALSGERTGVVGVYNTDDMKCANWLVNESNPELQIVTDVNTGRLLEGMMQWKPRLYLWGGDESGGQLIQWTLWNRPVDNYYVFLSTWNVENGKTVLLANLNYSGTREVRVIPPDVYNLPVVFQSGKSIVYEVHE